MKALIASRKGLFECLYSAGKWQIVSHHFQGDPVSMVLHDSQNDLFYAALNLGHFGVKLHSRAGANGTWQELAVPVYPAQGTPASGDVEWKLKLIWSLATSTDKAGNNTLWAGTLPGGLFQSKDYGVSWSIVTDLWEKPGRTGWFGGGYDVPGIHSICNHPADPAKIVIGISCGGVWQSADGGQHWSLTSDGLVATYMPPEKANDPNIQDPHSLSQCTSVPEVIWCQHHNGMWRSSDHGHYWTKLHLPEGTPDFGFAVAAHPLNPETAWFVPAIADQKRIPVNGALSVTRTRDGGKTFASLRNGLPQQDCYDLIYRHGLAVSSDGQNLMMGSTTGNVWFSDDGGDHWHKMDALFPPIYAVRFYE